MRRGECVGVDLVADLGGKSEEGGWRVCLRLLCAGRLPRLLTPLERHSDVMSLVWTSVEFQGR
jgi:hypothetical protein